MLTEEILLDLGFEKIPHFTITNSLTYQLSRGRQLSFGSVGTPNEMLFISDSDSADSRKITDLVCLHNYDYDGYMTMDKITGLINILDDKKGCNKPKNAHKKTSISGRKPEYFPNSKIIDLNDLNFFTGKL